ncbi:class I SAM-dependent methyltransferase [Gymnodinialimonas sp. 2305UL16-5]|uniref:class I SAM-dependent methyltransferase n=1 Tax=Gymnodinialimonas mytili TaxID=3126503 RepID=UPI0030994EFE
MLTATIGTVHKHAVFDRRVEVIADALGALVPAHTHMLDVGTGDGRIASLIASRQMGVSVEGIDIMKRPTTHIPVTLFDGLTIPHGDNSFDVVSFVDVLHHTDDPAHLIAEASRVARKAVLIKDHLSENGVDHATLRMMDWVGNAPHGVVLPYNYAPRATWDQWFEEAGLAVDSFSKQVPLYPAPLSWIFGRGLHFVARLTPSV